MEDPKNNVSPLPKPKLEFVSRNVVAIREDSITDSVHRLLQEYSDDEVDVILVAWRRTNENGSKTIHTNYHGWPSDAFGLLEFLKDRIREEMWGI